MRSVKLEWDSAFFGMQVDAVSVTGSDSARSLSDCLQREVVRLTYVFFDPQHADGDDLRHTLRAFGGLPYGTRALYRKTIDEVGESVGGPSCRAVTKPPALEALAYVSGGYSRFLRDPGLAPSFRRLYGTWLDKELARGQVFVRPDAVSPKGMVTVSVTEAGCGKIGLMAVDASCRGKGIGTSLMQDAESWLRQRDVAMCEVVTQGENTGACALYEKCGFTRVSTTEIWHVWRSEQKGKSL